ncbi:G-protein coupled receptor Mth2 isoform X1 [Solenopsis invicta]|uniref:G-protein coupled receptor Mth2 isoform X1 n=1 Tax=Solenopsis invicta TaxID=13686 RepID=UPI00193D9760|nr:G-protein coupled receptor Mth2 isoform X1 [Solenopsis invicta]
MRRYRLVLWCWTLLLVASSSESRGNSTTPSDDERNNSTGRYDIQTSIVAMNHSDDEELVRYNVHENSTKNNVQLRANSTSDDHEDSDSMYEFHVHSTKDREGGNQMSTKLYGNFTKADNGTNSTNEGHGNSMQAEDISNLINLSYELRKLHEDDIKGNVVPYEMCENSTCILLCCPLGRRLLKVGNEEQCSVAKAKNYPFPNMYNYIGGMNNSWEKVPLGKRLDQIFQLSVHDPCRFQRYKLDPDKNSNDEYTILDNGTLYLPYTGDVIELYCLAVVEDKYEITACFDDEAEEIFIEQSKGLPVGLIVSLPFLLATFVIYSILPELRNMHGYTLRGYVGSLFIAYTFLGILQLMPPNTLSESICIIWAFIMHFSFLASFFWLNVMCFDIWWTFGGFRSLQGSVKQRERKKFVMYSIYAWGSAALLSILCAVMDFVPSVPRELIRPEFGATRCWFKTDEARALYFYGPMSVTVICNICLFISTALKIVRHRKDTAHHLRSSESRRHDDNKQRFNLYLKLFIVMGINWSMEIISWLFEKVPAYVWYISDLTNTLQGLIIFIIFVWKEKIKRLLLKRFGCQDRDLFSRNSTRSGVHSSASRTCTTTMSLQEKVNPYTQTNCRAKSSSDEADT